MIIRYGAALTLALALTACSDPARTDTTATDQGASTPPPVVTDEPIDTKAAEPQPVPQPPVAPGEPAPSGQLASIPAAFQGTWDFSAEDCAASSSVGRLKITANELQFHESHATITRVDAKSPTHIQAFGKFEGEGQTWDGSPEFKLDNGRLNMTVDGTPTEGGRVKCS